MVGGVPGATNPAERYFMHRQERRVRFTPARFKKSGMSAVPSAASYHVKSGLRCVIPSWLTSSLKRRSMSG